MKSYVKKLTFGFLTAAAAVFLSLGLFLLNPSINASAEDDNTSSDTVCEVSSWDELSEAISSCNDGDTVKLTDNISIADSGITIDKKVTLDLNGHDIEFSGTMTQSYTYESGSTGTVKAPILLVSGADFTITDTSENGDGTISYTAPASSTYLIYSYGYSSSHVTLNIEGGTIEYTSYTSGSLMYSIYAYYSNVNFTGGAIKHYHKSTSLGGGIYSLNSTVTIDGGTLDIYPAAEGARVYGYVGYGGSELALKDGRVTAYDSWTDGDGNTYNGHATYRYALFFSAAGSEMNITGGTVEGVVGGSASGVYSISGGSFSVQPNAAYMAEGYHYAEDGQGGYIIEEGSFLAMVDTVACLTNEEIEAALNTYTTVQYSVSIYLMKPASEGNADVIIPDVTITLISSGEKAPIYIRKNNSDATYGTVTNNYSNAVIFNDKWDNAFVNNATLSTIASGYPFLLEGFSITNNVGAIFTINAGYFFCNPAASSNNGTFTIIGHDNNYFSEEWKAFLENANLIAENYVLSAYSYSEAIATNTYASAVLDDIVDADATVYQILEKSNIEAYVGNAPYANFTTALAASSAENPATLAKDVEVASNISVRYENDYYIDLNGHNLTFTASSAHFYIYHGNLTITNSAETEGKISSSCEYGTFELYGFTYDDKTVLTIGERVVVEQASGGYSINIQHTNNVSYGVEVYVAGTVGNTAISGNVQGCADGYSVPYICIEGTGKVEGVLYLAGYGKTDIYGTVESATTAVEIRAGELNVYEGAVINNSAAAFSANANGSGTTIEGAAIAISQHTTNLPINVNLAGGTFTGIYAVYEEDLQNETATDDIAIDITGGTFNGEVSSENVEGFIGGGYFSEDVDDEYIAEGYCVVGASDSDYTVMSIGEATEAGYPYIVDKHAYATEDDIVAAGVVAMVGSTGYTSLAAAVEAAASGDTVTLLTDSSEQAYIEKDITLDLGGHTLATGYTIAVYIKASADHVNIKNGKITLTTSGENTLVGILSLANSVTIEDIVIEYNTPNSDVRGIEIDYGKLTIINSTINIVGKQTSTYGIFLYEANAVVTGTTIETNGYGINVLGKYSTTDIKEALANGDELDNITLDLDKVNITARAFAVCGNGTKHGTLFKINDSELTSTEAQAIYQPQYGAMTISGETTITGLTGIEIRSGDLIIEDDTVVVMGTASPEEVEANGSGSTILGVAIAISQHSTDLPINVNISGGTYEGIYAVYEEDLQNETATDDIAINITGGTFNGGVYSENDEGFIGGGIFSEEPDGSYIAEGFVPVSTVIDGETYYGVEVIGPTTLTAEFNQGSAVIYTTNTLEDLKQYLTVKADLNDGTTGAVITDYTLSGTLTAGTSTITVTSGEATTTFTVNVTAVAVVSISVTYTQGNTVIYNTSLLSELKKGLTVTATYNDGSKATVTNYALSGVLTAGTSEITVSYEGNTATFNVKVTEYGHDYTVTWIWDGFTEAKAILKCKNHGETLTVDAEIRRTTVSATCEEDGYITYVATVVRGGNTYTDSKVLVLKATGHTYAVAWSWNGTTSATATFTCKNDAAHTETVSAVITSEKSNGYIVYTATAEIDGRVYKSTRLVADESGSPVNPSNPSEPSNPTTPTTPTTPEPEKGGLSGGAIAGIVIGVIVVVAAIAVVVVILLKKKKNQD